MSLIQCLNQEPVTSPYTFKLTGVSVFSFEEALYHCYTYWKDSIDDFVSSEFIAWVKDILGQAYIASQIKELSDLEQLSQRFTKFLSITDYFEDDEIKEIHAELMQWENRLEWEQLKERADAFNKVNEPQKAYSLYMRALKYEENPQILNNLGVCLMKLKRFDESYFYLAKAYEMQKYISILVNLAESAIFSHKFEIAEELLTQIKDEKDDAELNYLYGEYFYESGNIRKSTKYFEEAAASSNDTFYIYRLTDAYIKLRKYDNALALLETVENKDKEFLMKQGEVYAVSGHIPAAIKSIEKALIFDKGDCALWIILAYYHRLNYDFIKAQSAIITALRIEPNNEKALLEQARIKKSLGKTKDYQVILKNILDDIKQKYRELINET